MKALKCEIQFICCLLLLTNSNFLKAQVKITFPSKDNLLITADHYQIQPNAPYILLFHQARSSRGEYNETAVKLNKLGFNCIAIDLRSGEEINGIKNETYILAANQSYSTRYLDSEQDMKAAIDYTFELTKKPSILFGSSYSASLVLKQGNKNPKVKAIIAFSPGEFFEDKMILKDEIKGLDKPVFITSSKEESGAVTKIIEDIKNPNLFHFTPQAKGDHGSKALWNTSKDHREYWLALIDFLNKVKG